VKKPVGQYKAWLEQFVGQDYCSGLGEVGLKKIIEKDLLYPIRE